MMFQKLQSSLEGEFFTDKLMKSIYATDASVYRELPIAVAYPKSRNDIKKLIIFANKNNVTLIPRTAGTSLAGQCVGNGIVVDVSKYFTKIIETNKENKWVKVEPAVVRDVLNFHLKEYNLFFGPETSTANRAMVGGMIGNNASGSNSIKYGVTRDHILEIEAFLSDGSLVVFKELSKLEFQEKLKLESLEGELYRHIFKMLSNIENQKEINKEFPKKNIHRRNTGYAIDILLDSEIFNDSSKKFNFCKLIAGSEGTLAFIVSAKLKCFELPPKYSVLVCPHFNNINDALVSVKTAMQHKPFACELMDKVIMDCTKESIEYSQYRFFIEGNPKAILMIELKSNNEHDLNTQISSLLKDLKQDKLAFAMPKIFPPDTLKVWQLRKAGLGLLANIPGEKKAVAVIEDTAVAAEDLPSYIEEFTSLMKTFDQESVYYAHAGAGEIHLRPILNLKKSEDLQYFKDIAFGVAKLVKKYKGSLSGEHGDGRVRASFIEFMLGEKNYFLLKELKNTWDINNVFNKGKIIDAKDIDTDLRYEIDRKEPKIKTLLNFPEGILYLAEKCNGSGDCRKLAISGGTMCPSYMATRDEKHTTRARANILREFLTNSKQANRFNHAEIKEVLDLCLSCKGCKSECPSNVDMATLKAEFLYQYQKENGVSFRTKLFAETQKNNELGSKFPSLVNFLFRAPFVSNVSKKILGVAQERTIPKLTNETLVKWFNKNKQKYKLENPVKTVFLFADEFTNYNDVEVGKKAVKLLYKLNYQVVIPNIKDSGRTYISKGLLADAQKIAIKNIAILSSLVCNNNPIIGIEPSAILSFRDEYKRLLSDKQQKEFNFETVTKNSLLIDEFLASEIKIGNIRKESFTTEKKELKLHGHCHQKSLSKLSDTELLLSFPENYTVTTIKSGCCGMAGSFGYEKEHYKLSMEIGELVLFPEIRKSKNSDTIVATGTSCRHQIKDGTSRNAKHSLEVLFGALV